MIGIFVINSGATRGDIGPPKYFLGVPTGIWAPRVKGTRKVAPNERPMQTRGSYRKGPLQKGAPTDKRPLDRQGALTDKEFIQTRGPYRQRTPLDVV